MQEKLHVIDPASGEATSCARLLRVLADDTRLAVVERLLGGPLHVGEINETLGIEKTLLSHHLRVLRDAGLVNAERDGKQVLYTLAKKVHGSRRRRAIHLGCCSICFD